MGSRHPTFYWLAASLGLMAVGAFGPWAKLLAISVVGTDGSNDGWAIVALAAVGMFVLVAGQRAWEALVVPRARAGVLCVIGAISAAVALHDRHRVQHVGGPFVTVGWGLNLTMVASISLVVAAVVAMRSRGDGATAIPPE